MSDNVVKFRRIEKKPEKQPEKKPGLPNWWPFAAVILVACAIYGLQRSGLLSAFSGGL